MKDTMFWRVCVVFLCVTMIALIAWSGDMESLSDGSENTQYIVDGYFIIPMPDGDGLYHDLSPSQMFELIRPDEEAVRIGRLYATCSCIALEMDKTEYSRGERALFHLRNVKPTSPGGQTYAFFMQITSPIQAVIRYDVFVRSK